MTKLLVSVRNVAEARIAAAAGVHLIDVKEPARGSLGAADATTICAIAEAIPAAAPLSAALGELTDWPPDAGQTALSLHRRLLALPAAVRFAKLGLAGCAARADWPGYWRAALEQFPAHVAPVAVAYADARDAQAPAVDEVWRLGRQCGCRALLLDTCLKRAGTLLDWFSLAQLSDWRRRVHDDGAVLVLAGSLTISAIETLLPIEPDYVAVRGAACLPAAGRTGTLDAALVSQLAALCAGRHASV